MITDRDICMAAAMKRRDPGTIRVDEVMTGQVFACSPDTDIHEALKIMRKNQVRRLPIIDVIERRLAGMLSLNDVALKAQSADNPELAARDVEETMRAICAHRSPKPVAVPFKPVPQLAA